MFKYYIKNLTSAMRVLQENGLDPQFGYNTISGDIVVRRANVVVNLLHGSAQLSDVLELSCGGYNDDIEDDMLAVLREIGSERDSFVTDIAKTTGLDRNYVELIQYLICGADMAEYGGSPRGCWLSHYGRFILDQFDK